MKFLFILFISCTMAVTGCSSCPVTKLLSGKYYYSHNGVPSSKDSIFIYADGTYEFRHLSNGKILKREGEWEHDSVRCMVRFKNFLFFSDEASFQKSQGGNWLSRVRVENGEIRLMYSSEDNIYYAKTELLKPKSEKANIVKEFSGTGSKTEELPITGVATVLNLSYEFYKEADQLTITDQNGRELFSTEMTATNGRMTKEIPLRGVTKLVFKVTSSDASSKWKIKAQIK